MDAPDTATEAVEQLRADGYDADLRLADGSLLCSVCSRSHGSADAEIERTYRFEGPSDPGDEMLVAGLRCPHCGARGVLTSAFGLDADPALADLWGRGTTA